MFAGSIVPRSILDEAKQVTIPLLVLLQRDDEHNDRQMALDLFIPAMVIACGLHLASTAKAAPDPARVLPICLAALAWQFLHFAEEYSGRFWIRWPEDVFGAPPTTVEFFIWGNMGSYAAFTLGALALFKGWRVPLLIVWFFAIMGAMGNAEGSRSY